MARDRKQGLSRRTLGARAARSALAGAATVLAGACGVSGGPAAPATPPAAPARAPYTLQVWDHTLFRWREDVGKEITDPLLAANPWLTIETSPGSNDRTKFLAAAAGGTPPDTYSVSSEYTQEDLLLGATSSLERLLTISKTFKKADVWPSLRRGLEFKGALTAVPYAPDTRILYTHVENAQRAGLDPEKPPATWAELEAGAQKAFRGGAGTVQHLGYFPFIGSGGNVLWLVPYWQLGGELLSADGTKVTLFNDRAIEALTFLKRVVDNNGGWAAIDAFRNTFADRNGYTLYMGGGATYYYATLSERMEQFGVKAPTMRYTIASHPLPARGGTAATIGGNHTLPIARGSKNPEACWQFLEHVTSNDHNIKFALRFDRVPIRESSTTSAAYIQGDKGRALQAGEMKVRRFIPEVPGGGEMRASWDVVAPFMSGQQSLQDVLKERERQAQEILDKWVERARPVNP